MTELNAMSLDEALAHYGVKGMQWGVKRAAIATGATGATLGAHAAGTMLAGPIGGMAARAIVGSRINASIEKGNAARIKNLDIGKLLPNRNEKYSERMVRNDLRSWDEGSVKRVNDAMNAGVSRRKAVDEESTRRFKKAVLKWGVSQAAGYALYAYGPMAVSSMKNYTMDRAGKKNDTREFFRQARLSSEKNMLRPGMSPSKKNFRGAYNITGL